MSQLRSDFPQIIVEANLGPNTFSASTGWTLNTDALNTSASLATESLAWTDISAYVRSFTYTRGRTDEVSQSSGGTATIVLNNRDRRFEPEYASSPYYPYVLPLRRIRIRALWDGTTYDLFNGYAAQWPQSWSNSPEDQESAVACVDGFEPLNALKLNTSYSEEVSGTRIGNILDDAGWNSIERDIDAGQTTIQASTLSQITGLTHAQAVEGSELGQFFMDGRGYFIFRNRYSRFVNTTSAGTFGDDASTELPYESFSLDYTKDKIFNNAQITRNGGTLQEAFDSTSQANYFVRTWITSPLLTSDTEALNQGQWIVAKYKDPHLRPTQMVIRPTLDPTDLWPHALGRELGDRISYIRRPPAGGASITGDAFIDGLSATVSRSGKGFVWRTTWNLAPASLYQGWVCGDTTSSVLASTTIATY